MKQQTLFIFLVCWVMAASSPWVHAQQFTTPPGEAVMPGRSGLYPASKGNFFCDSRTIYRLIDRGTGNRYLDEVFSSEKEIKSFYLEKRRLSGIFYTDFFLIVQYKDGQYARIVLSFYLDSTDPPRATITNLPAPPGTGQPTNIAGDDLYCFKGNSLYVLRDQVNGPWLENNDGLPEERTLFDMNIDSFQNVWLICDNRLYMQPLVSNTWTLKNNLSGNQRVFIDRFQKIWTGRSGNVAFTTDQGTTMQAGPAGIGSGEAILGLSTDYNGDVYIMTYSFYPLSGGGNKIYRSAGGTAAFVRIDQNLAPQFSKFGSNQIYNGVYADTGVYVSHGAGIHFTKDAGATWQYITGPPSPSAYSVIPTNDDQLMMTSPSGAYKGNHGNWNKKHPADGFQPNINLFRAGNGDIYAKAEKITNSGSGDQRWVIYKSTDNGNNFVPDTAGMGAAQVGMDAFYVDEAGVQHAAGNVFVPGFGSRIGLWKKHPGQPWTLDTDGFPTIYNQSVQMFTGDGQGSIHCHFVNAGFNPVTYSRTIQGTTWNNIAPLDFKIITDQAGRADGISVFASVAPGDGGPGELIKKTGSSYTNVPLPNGINAANIVSASVTFDSSGALWAYFELYPFFPPPTPPNATGIGTGLFYTTDFTTWKKPANDVDTAIFASIRAIGDSVFALPFINDGVYVFKKMAGTIYTFTGNGEWTVAANWQNNTVPPALLPAGSEIIINPAGNGECILNTAQTVAPGGKFTVTDSKKLKIEGALNIIKD